MSPRVIAIVGAGQRVRDAALPALQRLGESYRLAGIYARTARDLEAGDVQYPVVPLDRARPEDFDDVDLVYLAVGMAGVPAALRGLSRFDVATTDLLIETPVLQMRDLQHLPLLRQYRHVWVAEDCIELPWLDAVQLAVDQGEIGRLRHATFFQSAIAHHAHATFKELLGSDRITRARRTRLGAHIAVRYLRFANGATGMLHEPRDYAIGRFALSGTEGSITDYAARIERNLVLEPTVNGTSCTGFRVGDVVTYLDDDEMALMAGDPPSIGVTARTGAMKRVGFLRLLRRIEGGRGAYPLEQGLDDAVVDSTLMKFGRWASTPVTSVRSAPARSLYRAASRLRSG